ncbi:hypothetical protein MY11210_001330 [Beauveria gryllotalpidicola]
MTFDNRVFVPSSAILALGIEEILLAHGIFFDDDESEPEPEPSLVASDEVMQDRIPFRGNVAAICAAQRFLVSN